MMNELQKEKLQKLINFLIENNSYYHQVFSSLKIVENLEEKFFSLPFLDRQNIFDYGLSGNKTLTSKNLKINYVFSTGGTTGKSKYIAYSLEEFKIVVNYLTLCYEGIVESDVVANLFMAGNMWASFIFVNKVLENFNCTILPIAGNTSINIIKEYINHFKPNVIVGIPSLMMQVISQDFNFIEKIYYAGESFLQRDIDFLNSIGCKIIKSGGYASVDADIIGYQCDKLKINQHHIFTDHQIVEIIDLDNEQNIWEYNKVGHIITTNLDRYLLPVIRYKTGDLAKWVKPDCSCNKPTIELMGRFDDWMRLSSYDFYYHDFAQIFHPYLITLKINKEKNLITVLIQKKEDTKIDLDFDNIIEKLKQTNWQLKEALEEKIISIKFEFVNDLPKTNKKLNVIYE